MWSNGKDTSEHGESVLLLQPVNVKRRGGKRTSSASSSHLGGLPCYLDDEHQSLIECGLKSSNPTCARCKAQMYLLVQLNAPLDDLDRTLYVFGCNNPSCHLLNNVESNGSGDDAIALKSRFCANLESVRCFRSQQQHQTNVSKSPDDKKSLISKVSTPKKSLADNDWGMDDDSGGWGDADDEDDWGESGGIDKVAEDAISMNDLETMLRDVEMQSSSSTSALPKEKIYHNQQAKEKHDLNNISGPSFTHHDLDMIDEPAGKTQHDSSDDEDDDDLGATNNIDASKVDSMLSRYLDMEDDEEIVAALKGGKNPAINAACDGGSGGGGGERYERLKPEEKAFLTFSKRLRRAPEQVCRYAYGGEPLWSIPLPPKIDSTGERKHSKPKKNEKSITAPFPTIPPCSCGAQRVFEFQLLPSLLHVLDVDSVNSNNDDDNDNITDLSSIGGMNWGSIAVYSCPESCDESREEFLIVQESGEDVETKQQTSEAMSEDENDNGI